MLAPARSAPCHTWNRSGRHFYTESQLRDTGLSRSNAVRSQSTSACAHWDRGNIQQEQLRSAQELEPDEKWRNASSQISKGAVNAKACLFRSRHQRYCKSNLG